jgi:hypothetical protein
VEYERCDKAPHSARLDALESRHYAWESRLRALELVCSGSSRTPFSTFGTNNNHDSHLSQEFDALASTPGFGTVLGADTAIFELNHNYASAGLEFAAEADVNAHTGAQHIDEQMDEADFGNFVNLDLASEAQDLYVQPSMLSFVESQDVPATHSILDNAATFTPVVLGGLQSLSVPLAPVANAVAPVAPVAPRVRCNVCGKTFGRSTDRRRHENKHNQNAPRYPCPRQDCRYSGLNGMLRKDKLREHQARHGH